MITQDTLRTILTSAFKVDQKYIVLKQGNWWNVQDKNNSGTWIAYVVRNSLPSVYGYMQNGTTPALVPPATVIKTGSEIATSLVISDIELQIVGKDAERLANSIQLWLTRQDIIDLFDAQHAQLCGDGLGDWTCSSFMQEGLNSVLAYNTRFRVQWANMIDVSQTQVTEIIESGNLTIGA